MVSFVSRIRWLFSVKSSFRDSVEQSCRSALAEFGIICEELGQDLVVHGASSNVLITIEYDWRSCAILIDLELLNNNIRTYESTSLSFALMVLEPDLGFLERHLSNHTGIPCEMERQMQALVQHCQSLLQGNHEDWAKVQAINRMLHGPTQDETTDEWKQRLSDYALDAYARGQYLAAAKSFWALVYNAGVLSDDNLAHYYGAERLLEQQRERRNPEC